MTLLITLLAAVVGGAAGFLAGLSYPSERRVERELACVACCLGGAALGALVALWRLA